MRALSVLLILAGCASGQSKEPEARSPEELRRSLRALVDQELEAAVRDLRARLFQVIDRALGIPPARSPEATSRKGGAPGAIQRLQEKLESLAALAGRDHPMVQALGRRLLALRKKAGSLAGYLGVEAEEPSSEFRYLHRLLPGQGFRIVSLAADGAGQAAGLEPKDVIVGPARAAGAQARVVVIRWRSGLREILTLSGVSPLLLQQYAGDLPNLNSERGLQQLLERLLPPGSPLPIGPERKQSPGSDALREPEKSPAGGRRGS